MKFTRTRALLISLLAAFTFVTPSATASVTASTAPIVAVLGDSYTAGFGASAGTWDYNDAWWQYTARNLGWQTGVVNASPGGGYQQPGDFGTFYQETAKYPIAANTNVVIIQGGLNDSNGPNPAYEAKAVRNLITLVLQQAPNAHVIVLGAFNPFPTRVSTATSLPMARAIASPDALGPNVTFIDPFLLQFDLASDGVHPNATGHRQIGEWVAEKIKSNPEVGKPATYDAVNGWWTV